MMGRTHATSGAVAYLAIQPLLDHAGILASTPATVVIGTIAAAGAALLPDLDHEHATVTQSLGPVTRVATKLVSALSGGHRNGTHSLLGLVVFVLAAWAATLAPLAFALTLGFLFSIALSALHLEVSRCTVVHTLLVVLLSVAALWVLGYSSIPVTSLALPVAVGVGIAAHIAGDMLTKEGCPLFYPFWKFRFHILSLTTGGPTERAVVGPALGLAAVGLCLWQSGIADLDWNWLVTLLR